ncbi:trypsin-like serine protease [Streptomyces sp. STR69]|uniref:trypsin-like serine protease n=1 Tax=Streptomyces sp. STR69 TaxID=1796942 RepID=UPI0021C821A3|nr:trypsin-like serine protease [Streptomyces sp. STR69]
MLRHVQLAVGALPMTLGVSVTSADTPSVTAVTAGPDANAVVAQVNASSPVGDLFNGQFCGGVLVAPDLVLTAAHGVRTRRPASVDAVVGDNLCHNAPVPSRRLHVQWIITYPSGRGRNAALLVLTGAAGTVPARLPAAGDRTPATATEFGRGRDGCGGAPCRRTAVPLRFVPANRCATARHALVVDDVGVYVGANVLRRCVENKGT